MQDNLYATPPAQPRPTRPESQGSPFQEAKVTLSRIKAGFFGEQGTGKTTTAFCIALGLSKLYHGGAPIFMHDTEAGSDFLVELAAAEGVKLFVRKSRSFRDMTAGLQQAVREGACCYIEDSISSDWNELMESFKRNKNISRILMQHWSEIKPRWNDEWVVPMLNAPIHVLTCGRQGDKWEDIEESDGNTKAIKVGVKMKAEGEFGYEPFLLLWMEAEQKYSGSKKSRKVQGGFVHRATVLKDKSRRIQGLTFQWPDINNYKVGDWKKVFDQIKPHIDFFDLKAEAPHAALAPTGQDVIFTDNGNSDYYKRKQEVQIALEEIEGTLTALWPGQDAKSKKFKAAAVYTLFGTRSWTAVTALPIEELNSGLQRLRGIELRAKNSPLDEEEVVNQVLQESMGKSVVPAQVSAA